MTYYIKSQLKPISEGNNKYCFFSCDIQLDIILPTCIWTNITMILFVFPSANVFCLLVIVVNATERSACDREMVEVFA